MNKDLAGVSAVWRALFGGGVARFYCLSSRCQRAAENGFAADFGSVSGDGRSFRCCTVGELLRDCDLVSVRAVQEKCDEKRQGREVRKSPCARRPWNPTPSASLRAGSFRKVREKDGAPRRYTSSLEWPNRIYFSTPTRQCGNDEE